MNKIKLNKGFLISYIILSILTIIVFILLIYFNVFKKKQSNMSDSYNTGFGYYSDPIEGPCLTKTGECSEKGSQQITKKCVPHPITGKGCILKNGTMSYDDLVEKQSCKKQCVGSAFNISNGLDFIEKVDTNNVPYTIILGSGGNKIVNDFGIDLTDQFIELFDAKENKYQLKKCFNPNQYQVYSTTSYNCNSGDSQKASNNCLFTCGIDDVNSIKMPLITDNNIGIKIPNYPKINGRYVCYDKFGNNQIEIFNSGEIPNNFVYPNYCYEHYLREGTSYSFNLTDNINTKQIYFTLLNETLPEYNLYSDYNFYHPLRIGYQNTMVEKIVNLQNYVSQDLENAGYIYIDMETDLSQENNLTIVSGANVINLDYFLLEDKQIFGVKVDTFLDGSTETISDYFYKDNTMFLNYSEIIPSIDDYIFYRINNYNIDHESNFGKITSVDTGTSSFGVSVLDLLDNAYQYKIKFWNTNQYFDKSIDNYKSLKNRIINNNYFLSDLLLPQTNFSITNNNNQLVDVKNLILDPIDNIFYLYSEKNNYFYYPVSLENINDTSYKFNIPEYEVDFYLLKDGISDTIFPPSKFLNYNSFEELTGYIQAETVAGSYKSPYNSYIKQIKILSSGVSSVVNNFKINNYIIDNFIINKGDNTVVKRLSTFTQNISDVTESTNNAYVDKIKLYNDIFIEKDYNFVNQFGNNFEINIDELKATVLKSDYTVFRTPSICYNQYNLPVQPGTVIKLQPKENIIINTKDILNSDDHRCGFYGTSGGLYEVQERVKFLPSLGTSTLIVKDYNNYYNYLDFLTPGYELTDLFCFKNLNGQPSDNIFCREPYITKNYDLNNFYNPDEDLTEQFKIINYFVSNQDNNINNPSSAKFWNLIKNYNNTEIINFGDNVYNEKNNSIFIYNAQQEGYTGEDLTKLGVYYLYNKSLPIYQGSSTAVSYPDYYLYKEYYQNNWNLNNLEVEKYKIQPKEICANNISNFIYDIGISIGGSGGGVSLFNSEYSITTLNNFEIGDYINPDFNLFNSGLLQEGISVFDFDKNTAFDQFNNLNNTTFNNCNINSEAMNNNLVFIAFDNYYNILDEDFYFGTDIYNYSFEICRIKSFDIKNKEITLERNLMNYPKTSLFNGISVPHMAYKFSNNFNLNLLFPITKILDNIISFTVPIYFNNLPTNVSIKNNCQSRTAFSLRIIKKEIEIPNYGLQNSNNKLYLVSSPEENHLSAYLDLMIKIKIDNSNYIYYFNEYRNNNYQNNGSETTFKNGDIITMLFPTGNSYDLSIIQNKIVYQDKVFDYYSVTDQNITELTLNNNYYNINYFDFTNSNVPNYISKLTETINPDHKNKIEITTNSIGSSILPINYSSLYYQGVSSQLTSAYYNNNFIDLFSNQFHIDIASNNLIKMNLKSTKLYNDLNNLDSYLTITNIISNEKPFGPSYLNKLTINNTLDLSGYGTIINFEIDSNYLEIKKLESPLILTSLSGFRFSFAENISKFSFINVLRKNIQKFDYNKTYGKNDIISYNYNNTLIYNNTNDIVSQFNSNNTAEYNQAYYIFQDNFYKYPLYLEKIDGGTSIIVNEIKLWYNNIKLGTSKPNINIYKEFTNLNLTANSVWKQNSFSIYPINNILEYDKDEYYSSGQLVKYDNDIYTSLIDNYNNTPNNEGVSWEFNNNYKELYNNQGNFFNINTGISTIASNLTLPTKNDINNYPISIIDYSTKEKYGLFTNIKGINDYQDKLSGFLNLNIFSLQKEILAKVILIKNPNNNNIASLASSPCTEDDLSTGYGFFKQFSPYKTGNILSQYIYDINLPDKNYLGKPFCVGNTNFNNNISSYQFSNSISFIPVPVALEYQDYPFTIYKGTSVCKLPINSIFNYQGTSTINAIVESSNGNINYKTITFKKSFYQDLESGNYNSLTLSGNLYQNNNNVASYSSGPSSNYIVANLNNYSAVNNEFLEFTNNNQVIAVGKVILNQYQSNNIDQENINLIKINSEGVSIHSNLSSLIKVPNNYIFTANNSPLTDGNYSITPTDNTGIINSYLTFDDDNNFINFNEIYISNDDLTFNDKIYFLSPGLENNIKIKLYGFFQNEFLSPVIYQTKNLIKSSEGEIANLIFSPFTNQLLNPYKNQIQLIESDGTSNVIINDYKFEEFNNVFNLGVSNNLLSLKPNSSKYPIYDINSGEINNDFTILPNIGVSKLGFINTNSVIDLISTPFDINNYVILGGISDVIPTKDNYNDTSQYYRETKGALNTNLNYLLNCSIYQEDSNNNYPVTETVECHINNKGLYNIQSSKVNGTIFKNTLNNSIFNTNTILYQLDNTNIDFPIYISTKGGNNFKNNIIYNTTQGTSFDIIIKYYFNSVGVSRYYDLNLYNKAQSKYISIVITKNNFFQDLENQKLYLGTSSSISGLYQFTNGISTLTYQNF